MPNTVRRISEPSEATSRDKPPPPKRSRRTTEAESPEQKPLQASSDSQLEDALKSRTRKSMRAAKTKVFEDFVSTP
ncbi:hypothetical protein COOONC_21390 [Cooperia oncophora]